MRRVRVLLGILAAVVLTVTAVPMVVAYEQSRPARDELKAAALVGAAVYGIDDNNVIWEIDPINKTFTPVNDTKLTGTSNSMAYDTSRDQFFFIHQTSNFTVDNALRTWNRASTGPLSVPILATRTQMGLPAQAVQPANASYYDNAYWFIPQNSTVLHRVSFTYAGDTPTAPSLMTYQLSNYAAPTYPAGGFGDIAIDSSGILWGSHSSGGRFFKIDLNLLGSTSNVVYTQIKAPGLASAPGYQLSFDGTYQTLFAHNFANGAWYTVDKTNGDLTNLNFATVVPGGATGFRDLGGASMTNAPAKCAISDPNNTNNQSADVDTAVANAPAVLITDVNDQPVQGVPVVFAVATGDGNLGGQPTATTLTSAGGLATAPAWTLGSTAGTNTVTATVGTLCTLTFTAQGLGPGVPAIELTKTRSGTGTLSQVGEVVTWNLVATNTGDVELADVTIDDPLVGSSQPCGTLAPQATCTWTVTYTLQQADVDAARVINEATVTGTYEDSTVTDEADSTVPVNQLPNIGLQKRAEYMDPPKAGEVVTYRLVSTNSGNVTLSNVTITDALVGLAPLSCDKAAPVTLSPGETLTCTTSYTLSQNDIDTGELINNATTKGLSPRQQEVTAEVTLTVPMTLLPRLGLTKELAAHGDANGNGSYDPGDTLTWTVTGSNLGNVTLFNVVITDPLTGDRRDCGTLTPQQTCAITTATYTITDADGSVGRVLNDATITGRSQTGTEVTEFANNTVLVEAATQANAQTVSTNPTQSLQQTLPRTGATVETAFWGALALLIAGGLVLALRRNPGDTRS